LERMVTGSNPNAADYSQLRNLSIVGGSPRPQDIVVVHAVQVTIADCYIYNCTRYGILIESGFVGAPPNDPLRLRGVTLAPNASYISSDFWRLSNTYVLICGNWQTGSGSPWTDGAGVFVHGQDANGGYAQGLVAADCNTGFSDHSQGGSTWVGCYSTTARVGYDAGHPAEGGGGAGETTWVGCFTEDVVGASVGGSPAPVAVGGTLAANPIINSRVGVRSELRFSVTGGDGQTYAGALPGGINALLDLTRASSTWSFAYQPSAVYSAFQQNSWRWFHRVNGAQDDAIDVFGGPFGWTDTGNPRGVGLPFIANPLMNTWRHWTHKQSVTVAPGTNTVYLNGGATDAGAVTWFLDIPTAWWSHADTRLSVNLEFATLNSLQGADCRIVGYAFIPKAVGRNAAVKIVNSGASSVVVTIVWNFGAFVTNADAWM
jgi:hypothetical protein